MDPDTQIEFPLYHMKYSAFNVINFMYVISILTGTKISVMIFIIIGNQITCWAIKQKYHEY